MTATESTQEFELTPVFRRLAVVVFLGTLSFAGFEATFSLFGARRFDLTEGSNAMVLLFVGVVMVAVQGVLIGPFTNVLGSRRMMRIGLAAVSLGLLGLAFTTTWVALFLMLFFIAFGQGLFGPSSGALTAELAPPGRRGEILGYQQSASALGRVLGPVLGGALFDARGVGAPYVVSAVVMVCALAVVWNVTRGRVTATTSR